MKVYQVVDSEPLQIKLCELMGLDPGLVASMTISLTPMQPINIFVTLLAEEKILDTDFSVFTQATEIKP